MRRPSSDFWAGKRVFVTGHTGFKGSWLTLWLRSMGATVRGYALASEQSPSLFELAHVASECDSLIGDIRDQQTLEATVSEFQPDIVLHLAAQALVRKSLQAPAETFDINVTGTAHVLDAVLAASSVQTVLVVTSDKVYANNGSGKPFVENDTLGGKDPYSASKAACEILVSSYRQSFFEDRGIRLATARAGNVIGGGDFSADRLIPDCVRANRSGTTVTLRNPDATRPWQHVLDCLNGYLIYVEHLSTVSDLPLALNFGPQADAATTSVATVAMAVVDALGGAGVDLCPEENSKEAPLLALNTQAARTLLNISETYPGLTAVTATADWYRAWADGIDIAAHSRAAVEHYMKA